MDHLYSRSTSQRSENHPGQEPISNASCEHPPIPTTAARREDESARAPLLAKPGPQAEGNCTFFQALFKGMNILAGNFYIHAQKNNSTWVAWMSQGA
jgi:hypothetical protein